MDERAVEELRELERRDAELAARGERLRGLDLEVAAIRGRAEEIDAFFARLPEREARLREQADAAAGDVKARRSEAAEAEVLLAGARDDAREPAERALARALDHLAVAETRVARIADDAEALEREASASPDELPGLTARSAAVSAELQDLVAPDPAPLALVDWAAAAHASLFVALGQLDTQRERVIREANELATMLLGEPTYGATVTQARNRVEASLP